MSEKWTPWLLFGIMIQLAGIAILLISILEALP